MVQRGILRMYLSKSWIAVDERTNGARSVICHHLMPQRIENDRSQKPKNGGKQKRRTVGTFMEFSTSMACVRFRCNCSLEDTGTQVDCNQRIVIVSIKFCCDTSGNNPE
mmetsp:Transcript_35918/g.86799  ORF Transcript_35918/g.86799 Transcript_35918/m.86799 type:complete len:109 (-) Transcript_35918:1022-1348(-)